MFSNVEEKSGMFIGKNDRKTGFLNKNKINNYALIVRRKTSTKKVSTESETLK
jgi:hypothetical protein